jgi:glycosyltransferase involved in cell wall biosynthesis
MNIGFVADRYYPIVGGVETQTRLVVQALQQSGHDVRVVATTFGETSLPSRLRVLGDSVLAASYASFDDDGTPVHALTPSAWDRVRMLPAALRAVPMLRSRAYHALRQFGYRWYRRVYVPKLRRQFEGLDVVHSVSNSYLGWAAQEAAASLGIPFVCTPYVHPGQHGDDPESVAFYNRCDAVMALIETDREFLVDLGVDRERIHLFGVVPLLPETSDAGGFRARHGLGEKPVVLFVGRMVDYKGTGALAAAAERVWETQPDAQFVFVGPGAEAFQATLPPDEPRFHVLGFVSKQEKADAYAACDVFCMPSRFEILPAVYLEAWSYGKPVVGGPAHGLDALIEGHGAGLVAEQTPASVAQCLLALLTDPERRREAGQNGRQLVEERYTLDALLSALETTYDAVEGAPADSGAVTSRVAA